MSITEHEYYKDVALEADQRGLIGRYRERYIQGRINQWEGEDKRCIAALDAATAELKVERKGRHDRVPAAGNKRDV